MPAIDKAIHHHAEAGSWDAAAIHIAVFLQWAAERGLTSGDIDRARVAADPLRYLLDDLDGTLPDGALTAEGAAFALAIWEEHRETLAATAGRFQHPGPEHRRRHFVWLDERLGDNRRLRGEPHDRSLRTAVAFLALATEGAGGPDAELARTIMRALDESPTAVHLLEVAPPRAAVGARPRKLFYDADARLARFGAEAWDAVRDVVSPLEVDPQDLLDVFGDEACAAWLVSHLARVLPGVDTSVLQRVVNAQFFVEVLDAGDTPLVRGAIVTQEEFGAAVGAAYADGATPPTGRRRIVGVSQVASYRRPLRERQAAPAGG
ncbi:hypothetical protein [Polyangium sp. 6x1]|uniref:hypothetical protein n=1 Tax=Polyangium sp. 6x1 TaxID=3042689 RepID=UPI002482A2C6|nr:hypothetical protein [Polyangium sp. 6x1]MDI1447222.1 hypothetical protein [Polyangium sp. 6x1]